MDEGTLGDLDFGVKKVNPVHSLKTVLDSESIPLGHRLIVSRAAFAELRTSSLTSASFTSASFTATSGGFATHIDFSSPSVVPLSESERILEGEPT